MPEKLRIAIGSDEAGYQYKEAIKADLLKSNLVESVQDVGIEQDENTAYPHIAIAAARMVARGDTVILLTYGSYDEVELADHRPRVVHVSRDNRIVTVDHEVATLAS